MTGKSIYLDNGAATKVAKEVAEAMYPYFTENYGNASSLHSFGSKAKEAIENSRNIIAKTLNAEPKEIIFTSGGTESNNLAIIGTAKAAISKNSPKKHIITTKIEHPSVIESVRSLERLGFSVDYLDVDSDGFISAEQLKSKVTEKTLLVSVMHANNEIGTIEPVREIGTILSSLPHKVYFHVDAVQSYSKVKIDVNSMNIDLLSISSHKIHGPKGVGALFIKKGADIEPILYGGGHEFNTRAGTENVAGIVGFSKASELAFSDFENSTSGMASLRDSLISQVEKSIPDTILNGPRGEKRLPNNVNFSFKYVEGESILLYLDMEGIAVSTGSACSSLKLEPSHVLTAIGRPHEVIHGSIRFTLSRYTKKEEISKLMQVLPGIVQKLRKMSSIDEKTDISKFKGMSENHVH